MFFAWAFLCMLFAYVLLHLFVISWCPENLVPMLLVKQVTIPESSRVAGAPQLNAVFSTYPSKLEIFTTCEVAIKISCRISDTAHPIKYHFRKSVIRSVFKWLLNMLQRYNNFPIYANLYRIFIVFYAKKCIFLLI